MGHMCRSVAEVQLGEGSWMNGWHLHTKGGDHREEVGGECAADE